MTPVAVFLCDVTGVAARPWAEAGFACYCVDLQHSIRNTRTEGNITYLWGDVRSLTTADFPGPIRFACGFPPCTDLTVAGARDFARKGLRRLIDSLRCPHHQRATHERDGTEDRIPTLNHRLDMYERSG